MLSDDRVAADLIRKIRGLSGLTQAELARRTGMQSSVLSAYEHGRRQPSGAALARIARAAGMELSVVPLAEEAALERMARVLKDVLDFADSMPARRRDELRYPPLIRLNRPVSEMAGADSVNARRLAELRPGKPVDGG